MNKYIRLYEMFFLKLYQLRGSLRKNIEKTIKQIINLFVSCKTMNECRNINNMPPKVVLKAKSLMKIGES